MVNLKRLWFLITDTFSFRNVSVYTTILSGVVGCYIILTVIWMYGAIRASRAIHKELVASILGTTLRHVLCDSWS
jgi:hypothetical protein